MKKLYNGLISVLLLGVLLSGCMSTSNVSTMLTVTGEYHYWEAMGNYSGKQAFALMKQKGVIPRKENLIVLSTAGYAEIENHSTMGFIDGISAVTGSKRGNNTLIEIHSRFDSPLWCAIYDKISGYCVYLQLKASTIPGNIKSTSRSEIFDIAAIENIDSDHLYTNAEAYNKKFADKIFGGNEFRIISIANALAKGAPAYAVRAFEYHDHYCPGITSGILMVNYIKKHFPLAAPKDSYFIQSVQPWCKEDALMTLLNATPGKKGYSAFYSTEEDRAAWKSAAKEAATIIYRFNRDMKKWGGIVLGFIWNDCGCPDYGKGSMLTKLCQDLWYLDRLDQPEDFITEIKRFTLPDKQSPLEYSRPGVDPMKLIGLSN